MMIIPYGQYVLYIEDDIEDVELLNHVLAEINFDTPVLNLPNGEVALEFLHKAKAVNHFPDIIFMDINMFRMNGKETFANFQLDKLISQIPVVVITTSNHESDVEYFRKYNVPYINKPGDMQRFKNDIVEILGTIFK